MLQPVTASGLLPPFLADATSISKQLSPNLQQGNAAGAVLHTGRHCDKTLRQDTATRYCGKTLRQGNTAGAAERLSGRHCGHACAAQDCCSSSTCSSLRRRQACSHPSLRMLPASPNNCHQICNKAMRQALCYIREDTATRHCDKTLRQDTAVRHYGKAIRQALRKDSPEDTADMLVRRKTVVHRRRAPA